MNTSQAAWQDWISYLEARGIAIVTASLLEAVAPLSIPFAQILFASQPILGGLIPNRNITALTELLENRDEYFHFVSSLKGSSS